MPFHAHAANNQWATVWRRVGTGPDGRPVVSSVAEEVECHWEDRHREATGPEGGSITVDATASGLPPPFDTKEGLPVGSAMAKGRPSEQLGDGQRPTTNAFKVETFEAVPDWRGRDFDVSAGLSRAADVIWQQEA